MSDTSDERPEGDLEQTQWPPDGPKAVRDEADAIMTAEQEPEQREPRETGSEDERPEG